MMALKTRWYQILLMSVGALVAGCNVGNTRIKPFIEPELDVKTTLNRMEIKNVPEELRYVPIHPSDGYAKEEDNGPIQKDSIKLRDRLIEIGFLKAGIEAKIGENRLDIYWNGSYRIKGEDLDIDDINERNYTNAPGTEMRGYGAALTYWTADYSDNFIQGINADLSLRILDEWNLILGGGYREYGIEIQRGWDRYDHLQKWKTDDIGDIEETSVYIGLGIPAYEHNRIFGQIKFGVNFYDFDGEKGIKVDNSAFFFGIGGGIRF